MDPRNFAPHEPLAYFDLVATVGRVHREVTSPEGLTARLAEKLVEYAEENLGPDNAIYLRYLRPLNVNGIIAERLIRSFPNVIEIGARPFRQSVLGHGVRIIRMQAEQPEMGSYQ
jgi:hypothetical protein